MLKNHAFISSVETSEGEYFSLPERSEDFALSEKKENNVALLESKLDNSLLDNLYRLNSFIDF